MKRLLILLLAVLMMITLTAPVPALTLEEVRKTHPVRLPAPGTAAELTEEEKSAVLSGLMEASLADLRDAVALGLVTSRELTAWYLERIEAYNKTYNCFITLCDDALEQAEARDRQLAAGQAKGVLFGVPVVVKDNIHVAGWPTTNGRSKSGVADSAANAAVVERLLAEGAVIVGKTNMSTDAQDARASRSAAVGETKNAYSPYLSAGGSSGGSAVAVSLNFAAAGLGTDTNSSLRVPAALSGCVALRVTTGLLPRDGIILLNTARDVPGAITRTVADQALMLDVLSGGQYDFSGNLRADALTGARIGVLKELTYAYSTTGERRQENLDDEVQAAFAAAVEELKACGAEVVEVSMPALFSLSEATFPVGGYLKIPALTEAFEQFLDKHELAAVVFPTYLSTPLRSGRDAGGTYWNLYDQPFVNNCRTLGPSAAVPEITVPIGVHSLGAGIGMQLAGRQYSEQVLLDLAYSYTERYDHRAVPAAAADLYAESHTGTLAEVTEGYLRSLLPSMKDPGGETELSRAAAVSGKAMTLSAERLPAGVPPAVVFAGIVAAAALLLAARSPRRRRRRYRGRRAVRR